MHTHPVDGRVEALDERGALQAEDQGLGVGVHMPDRTAGTEPARVPGGAGELHATEIVPPDGLVEPVLKLVLDELVWQVHVNPFWSRS